MLSLLLSRWARSRSGRDLVLDWIIYGGLAA